MEEGPPGIGLVLERVSHRRERQVLQPEGNSAKVCESCPEGEECRRRRLGTVHARHPVELLQLIEHPVPYEAIGTGETGKRLRLGDRTGWQTT